MTKKQDKYIYIIYVYIHIFKLKYTHASELVFYRLLTIEYKYLHNESDTLRIDSQWECFHLIS